MSSQKDEVSESGETEDLPSDFFDDFNKDEFMEGLSVIDECWDETGGPAPKRDSRTRIDAEAVDSVRDLRELIGENSVEVKVKTFMSSKGKKKKPYVVPDSKYKWRKPESVEEQNLDNFIKPGSRRDPSKTNEAIKKDKEVKVQQYLAKSLESSDDLRPPGTELDDYYEEEKLKPTHYDRDSYSKEDMRSMKEDSMSPKPLRLDSELLRSPRPRYSPRFRRSPRPHYSPRPRHSPWENSRPIRRNLSPGTFRHNSFVKNFSPIRNYRRNYSPHRRSPFRHSPQRRSPFRHSPQRRSPYKHSPQRRSPRKYSPERRSPRRQHRSRSPRRRSPRRIHSRSHSPVHDDSFLYPNNPDVSSGYPVGNPSYQPELGQQYAPPMHSEFPGNAPGFYPQAPAYGGGFPDPYNYGVPQVPQPGPVIIPNVNPVPAPRVVNPVAAPPMVPAPTVPTSDKATPYDALAQLVAEGKISQEDYLKLTPNKGVASTMDTKTRVMVLTRCSQALSKLDKLLLPNRLILNNNMIDTDDKYIAPQYCSPLKRQVVTEFSFTKASVSPAQQTKQLVESIVSTLGLDKVVTKYKKKLPKDMKDAVSQTTKPHCDVCEIRESTKYQDVGTSTEPEYFTSTVHTQVVEQDLISSRSIFNPSGSVGDGAPMSIAHMTPAQLVSQLAARAKTLKQPQEPPPSNQFSRRPPSNYDYDSRGSQYHQSYNNYRY